MRANIRKRLHHEVFISRGLASRDKAKRTGEYYSAESVLTELTEMLEKAKA